MFDYIRQQLELSGKLLSISIRMLPIGKGEVYAFVPATASQYSIYQFNSGGLYPMGKRELELVRNDAKDVVIDHICDYINQRKDHYCIFEEPN